jgi:hypothetical protein
MNNLIEELKAQVNDDADPIAYRGIFKATAPYNNVKPKVCYLQFMGIGVIIFEDGTWSIEDTT